jgi:hypothetical protein
MASPSYGSNNPNQRWYNLSRDGTVYDRRNGPLGCQVRVYYGDRDTLTDWLPVQSFGSAGVAFHALPRVGDNGDGDASRLRYGARDRRRLPRHEQ